LSRIGSVITYRKHYLLLFVFYVPTINEQIKLACSGSFQSPEDAVGWL